VVAHPLGTLPVSGRLEWVLLAYRLPREPSTPRIAVWRKLRRLGVVQVVDGLVSLPASARTREQFEWLADEIEEAGGEAWTWLSRSGSAEQDALLVRQLTDAVSAEYRELLDEVRGLRSDTVSRRTIARLRRELHRIEVRDHIGPPEREEARRAVERLAASAADAAEGAPA
jgi:hypothetical protein